VLHDLADLPRHRLQPGVQVLVSGHSHVPRVQQAGGVLQINPGSAGPRRFKLPVALALLELGDGEPRVQPLQL
jgi:predicted phosphodiesterase